MPTYDQYHVYSQLGNGSGLIYIANGNGILDGIVGKLQGVPNDVFGARMARGFAAVNGPMNGTAYGTSLFEMTNAAADNLTVLNIGGVAQISAPVAMVVGDIEASLAAIIAEVNSYNAPAPNNFKAQFVDSTHILLIQEIPSGNNNGDAVSITFSGLSTATSTDVAGGADAGTRTYTVFLDVTATDPLVIGPGAVDITGLISIRGLESLKAVQTVVVSANAVSIIRDSTDMVVYIDGDTTVGAANRVETFTVVGAKEGDTITLSGIDGAVSPVLTVAAFDYLEYEVTLTGYATAVTLKLAPGGLWQQITPNKMDAASLRNQGVAIPAQPGVYQLTPAAGTFVITPGGTGVSAPANIYEHDSVLVGAPVVLGADMLIDVTASLAGGAKKGDTGTIGGNGIAVTVGGNALNFGSNGATVATLTPELALSGLWNAQWTYMGEISGVDTVTWDISPVYSLLNVGFVTTDKIANLGVTDAKIANATITGSTKLVDGTVTEPKLSALVQAKLNRLAPRSVDTAMVLYQAVDGDLVLNDATAAANVVEVDVTLATTQLVTVTKIDDSANTVTVQDTLGATINGEALFILYRQYESVTIQGNGTYWVVVASEPQVAIACSISITGLAAIDVTAANTRCTTINLTSGNATETVTSITNAPKNVPFELRPETGLALTLTGTASGGASDTIVLQGASLVLDGTLDEYARFLWSAARTQWIYQDSNQGIV